jgi:hypothetical protein
VEKLQTAEIFVITTKLYSSEIICAIEQIAGRRPIDQNIIVIDPGFDIAVYQN